MAKHRAPRYVRTKKVIAKAPVAAGATALGLGVLSTSPASAATTHDWSGVANCESSGNWSTNTGNGYYGGLQFSQSTWAGYGGTAFAARADLASPAQQVQIAEKVLAGQGVGAWPVCGKYLTGGATAAAAPRATAPAAPAPAAPAQTDDGGYGRHAAPAGDYTVVSGDTVAKIAIAHGEAWQDLYQRNAGVIGSNPDLIFPGQVLALAGTAQSTPATTAASSAPKAAPSATTAHTITAHTTAVQVASQAAAAPAPAASSAGAVAEKVALEQLGRPYAYGGESPSGFDCSGLVQYAYQAAGVTLPRTTGEQMSAGTEVSEADLQVGDLVFFYGGTHVGIYVGSGEVVHAPVPGDVVKITEIAYMPYTTARRIG
jgi:cell wall-associated NlpC family hydrolase